MPAPTKSNVPMSPDGGGPVLPTVPKTELQELQIKSGEVTDEVSKTDECLNGYFNNTLFLFFFFRESSHSKVPEEC